jgi:NADH dehydrogenase
VSRVQEGMRVVVFGAGYAGLTVARRLETQLPADVELVVVEASDSHLMLHELHRVVRRPDLAETITLPLESLFSRATVRQARVTDIDAENNVATLATDDGTETLSYDLAAVCLGSETAFYGLPGLDEHARPLKRLDHARAIRRDALDAAGGEAVVGGAGLSGIQLAGELAALSAEEDLDLGVTLVEMADRIAPGFEEALSEALRAELEARDVTIETNTSVASASADAVELEDGRRLPYDVLAWTGGIRGPAALEGDRSPVDGSLQAGSDTFVVGDAAAVTDGEGATAPASAQTAIQQARVATKNIVRLVDARRVTDEAPLEEGGPQLHEYTYEGLGWVISVGDGAVARVGPVILSGEPAKAAKAAIGAGHLGSVGAIQRASKLVAEELGWPDSEAVGLPPALQASLENRGFDAGADPATPTEYGYPLANAAFALTEGFTPETVDLTSLTRPSDRDFPGSPANRLEDALAGSLAVARSLGTLGKRRSDDEA